MHDWRTRIAAIATAIAALLAAEDVVAAKTKKASDYFTLCPRSSPDFSGCVKNSIQEARTMLSNGIPELKMPPLDPLFISSMELREGQGNFEFVFAMNNLTMSGLKDYVVSDVKVDLEKPEFIVAMKTPRILCTAQYEMKGKLLTLPITGNGDSILDFRNVTTVGTTNLKNVYRKGKHYYEVESFKWDINVGFAHSTFTNLFNGDKTLGDTTNNFLNENWKEAFETYKHLPEEGFSQFFKEVTNRFYEQFTVEELYPE